MTLALLFTIFAATAGTPLDSGSAPHAVGVKVIPFHDYTRVLRPKVDATGKATRGERAMPLVLTVWYPAEPSSGAKPMTFDDYHAIEGYDIELAPPTDAAREQARRNHKAFFASSFNFPGGGNASDEKWTALRATPMRAVRDARAKEGSFPLIVASNGGLSPAKTAEYLAGHGFIVASVGHAGGWPQGLSPAQQTESAARNLEAALAQMHTFPNVDRDRLGVMGFSGAGFPPYLVAMRNTDIDAVVSIESGLFSPQFETSLDNPSHDGARLRVPFLHMMRESLSRADEDLSRFEKLRYSDRYRFLLVNEKLVHQDLSTLGPASVILGTRGAEAANAARASELVNLYILRFFEATVKKDPAARAFLDRGPEKNGIAAAELVVERRPAIEPAPSAAAIRELFATKGVDETIRALHAARERDPESADISLGTISNLGNALLNDRKLDEAKAIASYLNTVAPDSLHAHNHLGNIAMNEGQSSLAIDHFKKALVALEKTEMPPNIRQLSRQNIQAKIDRLSR